MDGTHMTANTPMDGTHMTASTPMDGTHRITRVYTVTVTLPQTTSLSISVETGSQYKAAIVHQVWGTDGVDVRIYMSNAPAHTRVLADAIWVFDSAVPRHIWQAV
jgi:hypothetical protein